MPASPLAPPVGVVPPMPAVPPAPASSPLAWNFLRLQPSAATTTSPAESERHRIDVLVSGKVGHGARLARNAVIAVAAQVRERFATLRSREELDQILRSRGRRGFIEGRSEPTKRFESAIRTRRAPQLALGIERENIRPSV